MTIPFVARLCKVFEIQRSRDIKQEQRTILNDSRAEIKNVRVAQLDSDVNVSLPGTQRNAHRKSFRTGNQVKMRLR